MLSYLQSTRQEARTMGIALTVALVASLALSASALQAKPKQNADDEGWDQWKGLSNGFVGRRKVPPKAHLKASQRRLDSTQKRGKKTLKDAKKGNRLSMKAASINSLDALDQTVKAVWLNTQAEGLYGASIAELADTLGKPIGAVRKKAKKGQLVLRNDGQPLSWYFDKSSDTVLFPAATYDTFYSDTNATRLNLGGKKGNALPMKVVKGRGSNLSGLATPFMETLKFEEEPDHFFSVATIASAPEADYWYWNYLWGGFQEQFELPLDIPSPEASGQATIRITLRGGTNLYPGDEHMVAVELNGSPLELNPESDPIPWDGFEKRVLVLNVDQSSLNPSGANTLKLSSSSVAGPNAAQWLDQIEIDYARLPVAVDDTLWMHDVTAGTLRVDGFSANDIMVIESPSGKAKLRKNISITADFSGGWSVHFKAKAGADYLITERGAIKTSELPAPSALAAAPEDAPEPELALAPDYHSTLKNRRNKADYLIVAPQDFVDTATGLQAHRLKRFSNVRIVWLKDIYDEFSAGREDPLAISRFLTTVQTKWKQVPSFITLIGKGTLDHKDRMGYADSFLPVVLTGSPWTATASDDKLLSVGDDSRFAVGRLPITNDDEGVAYLAKLVAHEYATPGPERFESVVIADKNDPRAGDFHANSDALAERLVYDLGFSQATKLYHPDDPVNDYLVLSSTWETGYVTYDGHGSVTRMGSGSTSLFTRAEAMLLENNIYPIFTALTCAVGDDTYPGHRSLAGALVLNASGGAVASLAPTGLSLDADAQQLGGAFVDSLYAGNNTLGDAVRQAKIQTRPFISGFMPEIYSVVGEPAVYAR